MGLQCASFRCELDVDVRPPFSESAVACCLNHYMYTCRIQTRRWDSLGTLSFTILYECSTLRKGQLETTFALFTAVYRFLYRIWKWLCAPW